jgi:hypothetical protein
MIVSLATATAIVGTSIVAAASVDNDPAAAISVAAAEVVWDEAAALSRLTPCEVERGDIADMVVVAAAASFCCAASIFSLRSRRSPSFCWSTFPPISFFFKQTTSG